MANISLQWVFQPTACGNYANCTKPLYLSTAVWHFHQWHRQFCSCYHLQNSHANIWLFDIFSLQITKETNNNGQLLNIFFSTPINKIGAKTTWHHSLEISECKGTSSVMRNFLLKLSLDFFVIAFTHSTPRGNDAGTALSSFEKNAMACSGKCTTAKSCTIQTCAIFIELENETIFFHKQKFKFKFKFTIYLQ